MKIYLELDQTNGNLYEFSKDPKVGFAEHTSSTGKVSQRRDVREGLIGTLKYINERDEDFGKGSFKTMSLVVEDKDANMVYMKIPLLSAKGSLNEYFESIATFLPNMKIGKSYRVFPYKMDTTYTDKEGVEKPTVRKGFSVHEYDLVNDNKLLKVERAHNYGKDGDIPNVVWTEVEDMGTIKNVKNDTARKNFLYKAFKSTVTADNSPANTEQAAASPKPVATASPQETKNAAVFEDKKSFEVPTVEEDDLPF